MRTGIIILAAGSSSRLGRPKQLIEYQGKNLLQRAIEAALASFADSVLVVLGWNPELIKAVVKTNSILFVENESWELGMTGSMQTGLLRYLDSEDEIGKLDQILIMLCDQVMVDTELLNLLIRNKEESEKGIVACRYSGTLGVPAIFDKKYFEELLALKGKEGAKKVILQNMDDVLTIDFPEGSIDLDTEEDFKRLTD
ncbi:nucleotidyltransferase family protein [Algoriphagus kandeliae]|uniref:Nucleotidyltransferase family protein n=1 Tax=Algoriphagus kandeliae TaxID=2562278 RepID=A0A4Y9QZS2_9BACT|nr:nucleotidyltransferase family protein [Algoriphagus kandeliae]TFV97687.1 nucleotidyltransferase family protein [Algoriphagus kandeliae]